MNMIYIIFMLFFFYVVVEQRKQRNRIFRFYAIVTKILENKYYFLKSIFSFF